MTAGELLTVLHSHKVIAAIVRQMTAPAPILEIPKSVIVDVSIHVRAAQLY